MPTLCQTKMEQIFNQRLMMTLQLYEKAESNPHCLKIQSQAMKMTWWNLNMSPSVLT